jgi:hypothetical protein
MVRRNRLHSSLGVLLALLALVVVWVAPAGSIEPRANGTVVVKVRYQDAAGDRQPLPGVEVWLLETQSGTSHYLCTDEAGKVTVTGITPDSNVILATGPAVNQDCSNPEFLNPDTGKRMFTEFYNHHHGVAVFDPFQVGSGETKTITMKVKTPSKQKNVCGGAKVTIKGTNGDDVINGTDQRDVINGLRGNDVIHGMEGDDAICGDKGNDELYGDEGNDSLYGEAGKDTLEGDDGYDVLYGGAQSDRCRTGELLFSCER